MKNTLSAMQDLFAKANALSKQRTILIREFHSHRAKIDKKLATLGADPKVPLRKMKERLCATCHKTGHNSRTCPTNTKKPKSAAA